ncbi:hypothetical protein BYT27DRAFT_7240858 [Phlegmacium glaucopus]|nr:hypothetical protein BYT27DRAFT_7240858 [Phlegmacium glaucopus]
MYYARPKNDIQVYLPWDKVVQNWFSDFWPIQNQNQNQMAGGEPEPEPNQNHGSVQLVLVLWTGSEPNFGIPINDLSFIKSPICLFSTTGVPKVIRYKHSISSKTKGAAWWRKEKE